MDTGRVPSAELLGLPLRRGRRNAAPVPQRPGRGHRERRPRPAHAETRCVSLQVHEGSGSRSIGRAADPITACIQGLEHRRPGFTCMSEHGQISQHLRSCRSCRLTVLPSLRLSAGSAVRHIQCNWRMPRRRQERVGHRAVQGGAGAGVPGPSQVRHRGGGHSDQPALRQQQVLQEPR